MYGSLDGGDPVSDVDFEKVNFTCTSSFFILKSPVTFFRNDSAIYGNIFAIVTAIVRVDVNLLLFRIS